MKYREPISIHQSLLCSGVDMDAQGYQDDDNLKKRKQAICSHKKLWQASMSRRPFQKFAYRALLEPAEGTQCITNMR